MRTIVLVNLVVGVFPVLLLSLQGCGAEYSKKGKLSQHTLVFYDALRWKKFQDMEAFIPPGKMEEFNEEVKKKYKDVKFVNYEITEIKVNKKKDEAGVLVELEWHRLDETIIHECTIKETWSYISMGWFRMGMEVVEGEMP